MTLHGAQETRRDAGRKGVVGYLCMSRGQEMFGCRITQQAHVDDGGGGWGSLEDD